jgi:hypothetical protein
VPGQVCPRGPWKVPASEILVGARTSAVVQAEVQICVEVQAAIRISAAARVCVPGVVHSWAPDRAWVPGAIHSSVAARDGAQAQAQLAMAGVHNYAAMGWFVDADSPGPAWAKHQVWKPDWVGARQGPPACPRLCAALYHGRESGVVCNRLAFYLAVQTDDWYQELG